jgi:hypothetical protein
MIHEVQNAWRVAAKELGFEFVAPFDVQVGSAQAQFHGYVPNFGSVNGAVFLVCETFREDHGSLISVAKKSGYFHSEISAKVYRAFDRDVFLEVLRDWGWFGSETSRPSWL